MSLLLWLAFVLAQDPAPLPDLDGPYKAENFDFEIGVPKGWTPLPQTRSTFFMVGAPAGSIAQGAVSLSYKDSNQPVTLAFLAEAFRKHAGRDYNGFKDLTERNVTAAGLAAHQFIFTAVGKDDKELVFVQTVIQRQLQEFFTLLVVGAPPEKERLLALTEKLLGSFRVGLGSPKEREERVKATWTLLKSAAPRPGFAGTSWHELIVGGRRLGWQKSVLKEAKVEGAAGWEFEVECHQEDAEGGTRTDLSKGSFTSDGSYQRVVFSRTVRTPKDPPVDIRESATLIRGAYKASREFLDQNQVKEFTAPEGTYLGDVAEVMRRLIALSPKGKNTLRVLEPFRDLATIEDWENFGTSTVPLDGRDTELIQALVSTPREQPTEYLYDPDGTLRRRKGAGGFIVLRRCTEQEALKK